MSNIKSILIVNDYLISCKLKGENCNKSILARKYLSYKISKQIVKKSNNRISNIFLYLLGFILIK